MLYIAIRENEPMEEIKQQTIPLQFSDAQKLVKGYVETRLLAHGVLAIFNEDAEPMKWPEHLHVIDKLGNGHMLRGPVLLCGGLHPKEDTLLPIPKDVAIGLGPYLDTKIRILAVVLS